MEDLARPWLFLLLAIIIYTLEIDELEKLVQDELQSENSFGIQSSPVSRGEKANVKFSFYRRAAIIR